MIRPSRDMRNWGVGTEAVTYGQRDTMSLRQIAYKYRIRTVVCGAIPDDVGDHRPGMTSAQQAGILAPLIDADISKAEIREASKAWSLKTWDTPAFACLSSCFPYGTRMTLQELC